MFTAKTVVLTDGSGNAVPNSWTINPIDGSIVPAYSTNSGFLKDPLFKQV